MSGVTPGGGGASVVDALPARRPRHSLLSAAAALGTLVPDAESDLRWTNGMVWLPESCEADTPGFWYPCPADGGAEAAAKGIGSAAYQVSLSPLSWDGTDYDDPLGSGGALNINVYTALGPAVIVSSDGQTVSQIDGSDAIHVALASWDGGAAGTIYLTTSALTDNGLAVSAAGIQAFLDLIADNSPIDSITADNAKINYLTAEGTGASYTFQGFLGFENPGTVAVVAGGTDPPTLNAETTTNAAQRTFQPIVAYEGVTCSTLGWSAEDWYARAGRKLDACLPAKIERELWTGLIAQQAGFSNDFLMDDATATDLTAELDEGDAFGMVSGLAEAENALCDCSCGGDHMIHAQRRLVSLWRSLDLVYEEGGRLRTVLGSTVVPGCGYTGQGLGDEDAVGSIAESWFYATSPVRVWLGPVETVVGANGGVPDPSTVDRDLNDVAVRAERYWAAAWDGCCHLAVRVNHETEYGEWVEPQ